ncbi:MAG: response regulator [bacterium]|nr:response regulator [bacterium]
MIIWYVDDSPELTRILKRIFASKEPGSVVCEFHSPAEFLEALRIAKRESALPDVLFVDFDMSKSGEELNGHDVCRQAKSICASLPTVLFTGSLVEKTKEIDVLLLKPASHESLMGAIKEAKSKEC